MSEAFTACFEKLEALSIEELDRSVAELVLVENRNVALVIAHLAEISRRKGELERGYRNLFEYGVRRLGLSEGSVALRIQVANVSRRFPQILAALAEGRISLSVAGRLAPHLHEDNVEKLLGDCAGLTKRQVEEYLVRLSPQPLFAPCIRKRPGAEKGTSAKAESKEQISQAEERSSAAPVPGEASTPPPMPPPSPPRAPSPPPGLLAPATPAMYNFRFAANSEFKSKVERLAEVLAIENPAKNLAEVLERALDLALEKKDPKQRLERRLKRERKRNVAALLAQNTAAESRPGEVVCEDAAHGAKAPCASIEDAASTPVMSRHIPAAVRDRVLERAGHQCQYTGPDGTRCTARTGLEIEHERPFAIFHSHDEQFLLAFCPWHNRLRAQQIYGVEHIHRKIEERRLARACSASRKHCSAP